MSFEADLERFAKGLAARKTRRDHPLAARTFTERMTTIKRLQRELGDLVQVDDILVPRLQAWRESRRIAYKSEQISEAKVRGEVFTLQLFYTLIGRSPNPAASLDMGPTTEKNPRPMERAHVVQLFNQLDPGPHRDPTKLHDRALGACLLNGLRRVEVCRLTTHSARYDATEAALVVAVHGKGNRFDEIPFGPTSSEWIAEYVLRRFEPKLAGRWLRDLDNDVLLAFDRLMRTARPPASPLFYHKDGPMTERELNRRFAKNRTQADLPMQQLAPGKWRHYGPHSLRHTFCTELLDAGVDSRVVQALARHSSITTTEGYLKVRRGPMARAVRQMYAPGKEAVHGGPR